MKLLHLSDLHLGKRLNEQSLLEDQRYSLDQILTIARQERPHGVLIAGDVYDKTVPPAEAVELFDRFLVALADLEIPVMIISGNHDSPERLAFGGRLMTGRGIYISPVYDGNVETVTLQDDLGPVRIWLLPFVKPSTVKRFFPEAEIGSYTDAVAAALSVLDLNPSERNVLLSHQFVTGSDTTGHEELMVGGSENVDAAVYAPFDYVALGHLHGPQNVKQEKLRYCGTPLKYSFGESLHHKSVTVVHLEEKGSLMIRTIPLMPLRDLRKLRGSFAELMKLEYWEGKPWQEDYLHITLTDEEEIPDAMGKLRQVYHNLLRLEYDNSRTRSAGVIREQEGERRRSPLELFRDLYESQNDQPLTADQEQYLKSLIQAIWEGET